jgi:hypothetical protein
MGHGTLVYKTSTAEFLDRLYEDPGSGLDTAQGLLDTHAGDRLSATTEDLNNNHGLDPNHGNAADFEKYWLSGSGPFGSEEVDRVLRFGYLEAIRIARDEYDPPVPIETFWVVGSGEQFELQICQGARCVTVFMMVPTMRRFGSHKAAAKSFVVRASQLPEGETLDPGESDQPPIVKVKFSGSGESIGQD